TAPRRAAVSGEHGARRVRATPSGLSVRECDEHAAVSKTVARSAVQTEPLGARAPEGPSKAALPPNHRVYFEQRCSKMRVDLQKPVTPADAVPTQQ
ncbi:MAG: hypothetical protein LC790_02895, partial [Actinobacteria bacterium]|nr:hypothetical protein [Actinomycetota bacterium]